MCLSPPLEDDDVKESSSVALAFVAPKLPNQQNLTEIFLFLFFFLFAGINKKKKTNRKLPLSRSIHRKTKRRLLLSKNIELSLV